MGGVKYRVLEDVSGLRGHPLFGAVEFAFRAGDIAEPRSEQESLVLDELVLLGFAEPLKHHKEAK